MSNEEVKLPSTFEKLRTELDILGLVIDATILHSDEEIGRGLSTQYERTFHCLEDFFIEMGMKKEIL